MPNRYVLAFHRQAEGMDKIGRLHGGYLPDREPHGTTSIGVRTDVRLRLHPQGVDYLVSRRGPVDCWAGRNQLLRP